MNLFLHILNDFLAIFSFTWCQADQKLFFGVMFAWFFQKLQNLKRRSGELSVVEKGQVLVKVVAEIERMFDFVPDVGWLVVCDEPAKTVPDQIFSHVLFFSIIFSRFKFRLCHFLFKVPLFKFFLKCFNRYEVWDETVVGRLFPGFSPWIYINRHGDKRLQDRSGPFFILGEDDNDQAKLVSLNNLDVTSWLKEVYENFRLLNLATPLLPIYLRVSPSKLTYWR